MKIQFTDTHVKVEGFATSKKKNKQKLNWIRLAEHSRIPTEDEHKYQNINKTQRVKKLEKRKRRLQRSISRRYEKNKKGGSYCKTGNIIKSEKELLKLNHRIEYKSAWNNIPVMTADRFFPSSTKVYTTK